jgi:hypothetical protein
MAFSRSFVRSSGLGTQTIPPTIRVDMVSRIDTTKLYEVYWNTLLPLVIPNL